MYLANPMSLLWLGLAVPIIVFYILKIRLRRFPVSTILFWRQIFEEKQPRSIWQHLRHLLSLLIQLVFLALLIFALAEPFFHWEITEKRRLVLVVDNSASMNATDLSPNRLEHAKRAAQQVIAGLRFRDEMAIVAAGTQPQVVCGLTGHHRTLEDALAKVTPTDGPTRVGDAVALSRRLTAGHENSQIVILTDGCFDAAPALSEAKDVRLLTFGTRTGNVAITQFQVRRSLIDAIGYQILTEVSNFSDAPVECRLEIDLNGQVVDVVPLKLEAGGKWSQAFDKTSAEGGQLTAKIDFADALTADNQTYALLPRREMLPVTLVTDGNLFLQKVFEANPLVKLTVTKELPSTPQTGVTVFHRKTPEKLSPGPILIIDPASSSNLWQVGDKLQNPIVAKQDKDSPLMMHVRLDNVLMPEVRKLTLTPGAQVLVSAASGEPLYAAWERPEGKVLVLSVNLDLGDLPLRTAFPIMTTNALAWFVGTKGELREALATGSVTDVELPPSPDSDLFLWSPDGQRRPIPTGIAKTPIGPLDQHGVWSIAPSVTPTQKMGTPIWEIACNLVSHTESDLRPPEALLEKNSSDVLTAGFAVKPLWFLLLAAAGLLAAAEWFLYQRRWIS